MDLGCWSTLLMVCMYFTMMDGICGMRKKEYRRKRQVLFADPENPNEEKMQN